MAYNVKFLKGTLENYQAITPDQNTFYYIDNEDLYLGSILLSNEADVKDAVKRISANEESLKNIRAELDALVDPDGTGGGYITTQLNNLRTELTALIDDNTDLIEAEERRALAAEQGLQESINTLSGTVNTLSETVDDHTDSIGTLTTNLTNLTTEVNTNKNNITTLQDDLTDLDGVVDGLSTTVGEHETELTALIGEDTGLSVRAIALNELSKQLIPDTAQEAMDTLEELTAWLHSHPGEVGEMNETINANTQAIEALQESNETNTGAISTLQEKMAEITHETTGILATSKGYTDSEIDKLETLITNLDTTVQGHTTAIEAINNPTTGILAIANSNLEQAIADLGLGTAAKKNVEDFDAAGSAAAALAEAKEYTNTALTWGIIETETQE